MINWAPLHPQVVHFVVALGLVGVVLRLVSLSGKASWTRPAGAVLLLTAAGASVVAVKSGSAAHGPVERIPGVRDAVERHESAGETTRNFLLAVGGLELLGLALTSRERAQRWALAASAVVGVIASYKLYVAADEGGELVYNFAGGPGLRSGDPVDVRHLLVAGLFEQAQAARDSGRSDEAARLTDELVRQLPGDPNVALLSVQSLLNDRKNPSAALAALDSLRLSPDNPRIVTQAGVLRSEALAAMGQVDSARAVLQALAARYPGSRSIERALAQLK